MEAAWANMCWTVVLMWVAMLPMKTMKPPESSCVDLEKGVVAVGGPQKCARFATRKECRVDDRFLSKWVKRGLSVTMHAALVCLLSRTPPEFAQ